MWFSVKEHSEFGRRANLPEPASSHQMGSEWWQNPVKELALLPIRKHLPGILSSVSD